MAGAVNALYSIVVLVAAVAGTAGVLYATRETTDADLRRVGLTGAAILLFVVALVVVLLLPG